MQQFFAMATTLAKNLRTRTEELGLTNNEVARRAGLHERRYANYAIGRREPDIATLIKIAKVLQSSPNELLGFVPVEVRSKRRVLEERMTATLEAMAPADIEAIVMQAEALLAARRK